MPPHWSEENCDGVPVGNSGDCRGKGSACCEAEAQAGAAGVAYTSGFPSVFKRSKGPILSRKRNKNISSFKESRSKSKFSQMLEKERKNQSEMAATNGNVDIDKIEIHQENLQRLASMTKTEIEQARNDLMSSMSPNLLALFKKEELSIVWEVE